LFRAEALELAVELHAEAFEEGDGELGVRAMVMR